MKSYLNILAAAAFVAVGAPALADTQVKASPGVTLTESAQAKFNRDTRGDDRHVKPIPGSSEPSSQLYTAAGLTAAGSWWLFASPSPLLRVDGRLAVLGVLWSLAWFVVILTVILRSQRQAPMGTEALVGSRGVVRSVLNPGGIVVVDGDVAGVKVPGVDPGPDQPAIAGHGDVNSTVTWWILHSLTGG